MIYHNDRGLHFDVNENKNNELGHGRYGVVYYYQDRLVKIFNFNKEVNLKLITEISEINHPNLYQIQDILYNKHDQFSGYAMEHIHSNDINLLTVDMDYFIENYLGLINLSRNLYLKGISIIDLHMKNLIINKDCIKIIDCDEYRIDNNPNFKSNKKAIIDTLISVLIDNMYSIDNLYLIREHLMIEIRKLLEDEDTIINLDNYKSLLDYSYKKGFIK